MLWCAEVLLILIQVVNNLSRVVGSAMNIEEQYESEGEGESVVKSEGLAYPLNGMAQKLMERLKTQKLPQLLMPDCGSWRERVDGYYGRYEQLFMENHSLNERVIELTERRDMLADKFNSLKRIKVSDDAVKRKRRYARDIQRLFHCPIDKCHRGYGSQGSLSHHVRLKHMAFYQSGHYQIFIQKYLDQIQEGKKKQEQNYQSETPLKKIKIEEEEVKVKVKNEQQEKKPKRKKEGPAVKKQ